MSASPILIALVNRIAGATGGGGGGAAPSSGDFNIAGQTFNLSGVPFNIAG